MVFFVIGVTVMALSAMGFMTCLGLWTYADAKVKSQDSPAMWTLIVLVAGFPVGFIIYLAVGRKKAGKSPGKYKKLLIASAACCIISIPVYILSLINFVMMT